MFAFTRARLGTSPAARRVDAAARALAAQRDAEAERHRRPPVAIEIEPSDPREDGITSPRQWAADQVAAWAERQPHIVVTFRPRWRAIVEEVAALRGVTVADLLGPSRTHPLVFHRQEGMYRVADETPLSLPEIGRRFGGRDHTTVLHAIRTHAARNGLPLPRQDDGDPS